MILTKAGTLCLVSNSAGYSTNAAALDLWRAEIATVEKLRSFLELGRGWHFGAGRGPSRDLIEWMIETNKIAYQCGFTMTDAFPGVNGNVMLTLYRGEDLLDVTIEEGMKLASITYEQSDVEQYSADDIDVNKVRPIIRQIGESCHSFAQYISGTTKLQNADLRAWRSKPMTTDRAYLYSMEIVPATNPDRFATTYENSTWSTTGPAIPQYFGSSPQEHYHRKLA